MDETISKWNEWVKEKEKDGGQIYTPQYLEDNDTKIIDLKYLKILDTKRIANEIFHITADVKKCSDPRKQGMCIYSKESFSEDKCDEYRGCLLCKLDYLIGIERVKIIV